MVPMKIKQIQSTESRNFLHMTFSMQIFFLELIKIVIQYQQQHTQRFYST